jgi:glutathione S-transferase
MYILHYSPGAASMAVHLALLEIGAPHELRRVDLDAGEQRRPEYLALNPGGTVPTLIVDGVPVGECAALLLLLAERHPEARLAPAPGSSRRGTFLQWMLYLANTLQPAFRQWFYPQDFAPATAEGAGKETARARIERVWDRLDAHLAAHGPHVLGADLSIADLYATMLMRWSRNMPRPATAWPAVAALARTITSRPSWQRLYAIEGLTEWTP